MTTKRTALIGAHISIAGGIDKAPARAAEQGCETFQCFSRSPQGGKAPELTDALVEHFKSEMKAHKLATFVIHAPYYINLASLKGNIRYGSIKVLREELERGSILGASFVMAHIGSHSDQTLKEGIVRSQDAIQKILDEYKGTTEFLIEISAGAGSVLGDTFEEIGEIIKPIKKMRGFGGVCFDTCHAFASGYDFRTADGARETLEQFDKHIGLEHLRLTHVNDSKFDLDQKRDRHEHVGKGFLGREGLAHILTTPAFSHINWILETEDLGREADIIALKEIRSQGY